MGSDPTSVNLLGAEFDLDRGEFGAVLVADCKF
jgi:hypothetical protein